MIDRRDFITHFLNISRLTLPIAGSRIIYIAMNFIGMLLIARLGQKELAAGALVTTVSNTALTIATSPLLAVGIISSRYRAQDKLIEMGTLLRQAWIISIIAAGLLIVFLKILPFLLVKLHQPPELIPLINQYFSGLVWGIIPFLLIASCHQFYFAIKRSSLIVYWSLLSLAFTMLGGFLLTYGCLGLPNLGIAGWAYATSLVNWIILAVILAYSYRQNMFRKYQIFCYKGKLIDPPEIKALLNMAWPITLQFSGELIAFSFLNIMVGWLGTAALSAQQIVLQCSLLVLMLPMSASQACAMLIGHSAVGQQAEIRPICYIAVVSMVVIMGFIALLYWFAPMVIIKLYLQPGNDFLLVNTIAIAAFRIAALSQIADATRNIVIGALRGLQDTWVPMWINIALLFLLALPASYLLSFKANQGISGLYMGFLLAFIVGAVCMLKRFNKKTQHLTNPTPVNIASVIYRNEPQE